MAQAVLRSSPNGAYVSRETFLAGDTGAVAVAAAAGTGWVAGVAGAAAVAGAAFRVL